MGVVCAAHAARAGLNSDQASGYAAKDRDLRLDLYETDVADRERNHVIDLEGTLRGLCDYSSLYCSEADKVNREIRKLQR